MTKKKEEKEAPPVEPLAFLQLASGHLVMLTKSGDMFISTRHVLQELQDHPDVTWRPILQTFEPPPAP